MGFRGAVDDTTARGPSLPSPEATRDILLLLLAATSGYVDAVSYLGLGNVFTANMTGNTVLLGLDLAQARGLAALRSAVALAGFVAGAALGSAIVERERERSLWPARVTVACAIEGLVLLAFAIGGALARATDARAVYLLIALSAIAMGVQSVAVRALSVAGVTTTYITGTWMSLASGLTLRLRPTRTAGTRGKQEVGSSRRVTLQAAVVGVYLLAAVAGGAAENAWRLAAILLPTAAVALVVGIAALRLHHGGQR
jgi:uncharacterized membrane protein YoaK (UPF0700 family)